MKHHHLKIFPVYFNDVVTGKKRFELRNNDRNFQEGETFTLYCWDPNEGKFKPGAVDGRITYVLQNETYLQPGICAWSFTVTSINKTKLPDKFARSVQNSEIK